MTDVIRTSKTYNEVNSRKVPVQLGDLAAFHLAIATADDYLQWLVKIRGERHGAVDTPMKLAHEARKIISRIMQDVDNTLVMEEHGDETLSAASFQDRVLLWMRNCFVRSDAMDPVHRSFRFTEEALELAQATGCSQADAHRLVDYVYNRPVGEASQEGGGVMVTLAALLTSLGLNLNECGEGELERCIENTDRIRAKDLAKPERSPLPGAELKANDVPPNEAYSGKPDPFERPAPLCTCGHDGPVGPGHQGNCPQYRPAQNGDPQA